MDIRVKKDAIIYEGEIYKAGDVIHDIENVEHLIEAGLVEVVGCANVYEEMTNKELIQYAKETFGEDISKLGKKQNLIDAIESFIEAETLQENENGPKTELED